MWKLQVLCRARCPPPAKGQGHEEASAGCGCRHRSKRRTVLATSTRRAQRKGTVPPETPVISFTSTSHQLSETPSGRRVAELIFVRAQGRGGKRIFIRDRRWCVRHEQQTGGEPSSKSYPGALTEGTQHRRGKGWDRSTGLGVVWRTRCAATRSPARAGLEEAIGADES